MNCKDEMVGAILEIVNKVPRSSADIGKIIAAANDIAFSANELALQFENKQIVQPKPICMETR